MLKHVRQCRRNHHDSRRDRQGKTLHPLLLLCYSKDDDAQIQLVTTPPDEASRGIRYHRAIFSPS